MEEATLRGFQQCYEPIMRGEEVGDVMSVGDPNQIARTLKRFAAAHVYSSDEKQLHQSRAHTKLQTILGAMMSALYERFLAGRQRHGFSQRAAITLSVLKRDLPDESLSLYEQYQRALDHISGMTDPYLLEFHDRLEHRLKETPDFIQ